MGPARPRYATEDLGHMFRKIEIIISVDAILFYILKYGITNMTDCFYPW